MQQQFDLKTLDGKNGFTLSGSAATGGLVGYAVSSAGDMNADGFSDVVLGVYTGGSGNTGVSYVIFGSRTKFPASFNLTALNGTNGFTIPGIESPSLLGYSVSTVGDMNGDGISDLVLGAPYPQSAAYMGISYVIFGTRNGFPANFNLTALNGTNGFSIPGVVLGGRLGYSVASASDINGDGLSDLVLGAPYVNSYMGTSYVIFGSQNGFPANFNLTTLNGTSGFSIPGIGLSDVLGFSVGSASDINGDGISDLVLGALLANNGAGGVYVIFGSRSGFPANFNLMTLNGTNGFSIPGIVLGGRLGNSVAGISDINGDGVSDLVLGANEANSNTGAGYVVFGSRSGLPTIFNLTTLNGTNGFSIPGIVLGGKLGHSVASASDINGDGLSDLILGAPYAANSTGVSYVVFGSRNGFPANFNLTALNGTNGFSISGITAGDELGSFVSSVSDLNGDGFSDLVLGADGVNSYSGASYVIFSNPFAWNKLQNDITIREGQSLLLNVSHFNINNNINATELIFNVNTVRGGRFEFVGNSGIAIFNFTQAQINANQIQFTSDRTDVVSYQVDANYRLWVLPLQPGNVTFINNAPIVLATPAVQRVYPNQSFSFSFLANQTFVDPDGDPLTYSATLSDDTVLPRWLNFDGAQFNELIFNGTSPMFASTQVKLSARDPINATTNTIFTLLTTEIWVNNQMTITQGRSVQLNNTHLDATGLNDNPVNLVFTVSNVSGGRFEWVANQSIIMTSFTQQQVNSGEIRFISDRTAPVSYKVAINNGKFTLPPKAATITFINNGPVVRTVPNAQAVTINETFSFTLDGTQIFNDPNNDTLTYSAQLSGGAALPSWLQFNESVKNQLTFNGTVPLPGPHRINLSAADPLNASISTEFDLLAVPKNATNVNVLNDSTAQITGGVVGGVLGVAVAIAAGLGFWRYSTDKKSRDTEKFADLIRTALNLKNVNNFDSENGQKYIAMVYKLQKALKAVGFDLQAMSQNELQSFANDVSDAARNKITPATNCWGQSAITVTDLNDNLQELVSEVQVLRSGGQQRHYTV